MNEFPIVSVHDTEAVAQGRVQRIGGQTGEVGAELWSAGPGQCGKLLFVTKV
jgi:hypothetical protein